MRKDTIVILTGAGVSAESGLGTFRDAGGLWAQHRIEDVATPQGFARNPDLVHGFYNARRQQAASASPNAAHLALARLQKQSPRPVVIITQNVDNLHEKAGSSAIHMHGELARALCAACDHRWNAPPQMSQHDPCPACGAAATRPDVVWFGEMPYHKDTIAGHLASARLFVAIGTSGQIYPAAGFVDDANALGAETLEINLERTDLEGRFDRHLIGPASATVPQWVETVLAGA